MKRVLLALTAAALGAYLLLPMPGHSVPLDERIHEKRRQVDRARSTEGVLTATITRLGTRVETLTGELRRVELQLARAQLDLDRKREELLRLRDRLERARDRLERLRRRLDVARDVLAARLIEIYKADEPDALTVVLEADGFDDLLERAEFLDRIARQDGVIVDRVRRLRDRSRAEAERLAGLEEAVRRVATALLERRDGTAVTRDQLAGARAELSQTRADRRAVLGRVRGSRVRAQEDLRALEAEQARVAQRLQAAAADPVPGGLEAAPIRQGSGQLIWPINGSITSPFGQRWGRLHAGLDIGAPEGTPIRAAATGRVVLAGWQGGYGLYTCIQHSASLSTCYAHQSRLGTSQGATVPQGEVMGYVGNTGNSFGAHLHFEVRVSASPVDPLGYL